MAHELDMSNNRANIAYVGAKPWHGLGVEIDAGSSIYEWQKAAGLMWSIERSPVQYKNGELHTMPERHVLYRSDTNAPLSVVSNKYNVVQPTEILEFFKELVEVSGFQIETAGSLYGGKRIWVLAKINREEVILGDDKVKGYLLLSTSCDLGLATTAQFTGVRVVCNNTIRMADRETGVARVTIPHNTKFDANAVRKELGIANSRFDTYVNESRQLAETMITDNAADEFIKLMLANQTDSEDVTKTKAFLRVRELYHGGAIGSDMESANGTAWGLLNAFTQYVDHDKPTRTADARLDAAWFGQGAKLKDQVFEQLLALPRDMVA